MKGRRCSPYGPVGRLPTNATPILEKFVDERLLIRSEYKDESKSERRWVSVEVAHEAMFRSWTDLRTGFGTSADILRCDVMYGVISRTTRNGPVYGLLS